MSERHNSSIAVFFSSLKMALATLLSRVLGLVREQVMAATFGAGGLTDAFLVAYRIPNLLRDLFAEGAFSAAFVPSFVETKQNNTQRARQLLWSLFIILSLVTLFIAGIIYLFAPYLIELFAPSFVENPEKYRLTVSLTRMMAPYLMFVSLAALFMGVLNSTKMFFLPATAPAFFNVAMILAMILLPSWLHSEGLPLVYSLGIGVLVGGLLQVLIQLPFVIKKGFPPLWPETFWSPEIKKILNKIGPGVLGFAATQINLLVNTVLATGTLVGAVSWLNYAFRLFQLPVGILGVSVGNSNLVHFSEKWKQDDISGAVAVLGSSYYLSLALVMPAFAVAYFLAHPIVELIFQRGQFSFMDTRMTALALRFYVLGLPFYAIYKIWVPAFYTIDRQKIPVFCSMSSIAVNILFCVSLTPFYGFKVLAMGTSLSMLLNVVAQGYFLRKYLGVSMEFFFNIKIFKLFLSILVSSTAAWSVQKLWTLDNAGLWQQIYTLGLKVGFVLFVYALCLLMLGEGGVIKKLLRR